MKKKESLKGKHILVVDDESDVLETLVELLPMCDVSTAGTFEEGKALLESRRFDFAILDIMGVQGYDLLEIAVRREITAAMLTAHALSPESIARSYEEGAAYFIPKEELSRIVEFLEDILDARNRGKNSWFNWMEMLTDTYWEKKFGTDWKARNRQLWDDLDKQKK